MLHDQNQEVFQTLASNTAEDFYKSFLQERQSLGTRQNLLSRPKVNKHPKRQHSWESLGDSRNFILEDYSL